VIGDLQGRKVVQEESTNGKIIHEYGDVICASLDALAEKEEFAGLRVFRRYFETWAETLYRIVKLDAAAFFCARKEYIVNNEGRGGNGKTLHQYFMLQMFG
jgi:hypothetical protein